MAAKGQTLVTLLDVSKSKDNKYRKVAEVLVNQNPMLADIPYQVMNKGTIHEESIRSGLPQVYYRKANQAIPASKTTTEELTFTTAHFESKSQMDAKVASRGGKEMIPWNRWNQAQGHIQAMANEHADLTIYGSPNDDHRKVAGFFDVYNSTSGETGKQVVLGGGVGSDNTSILFVNWGENAIFGIYEAGTQAGLNRIDRSPGDKLVQIPGLDENGNAGFFWGYEEDFEIDHGLVFKDYRQAARIANIDVSNLRTNSDPADIFDLMTDAHYAIENQGNGTGVIYANRTIEKFLHKQMTDKVSAGGGLTMENYQGKQVMHFLGRPIRRSDALLNTEAAIS